MERSDYLFHKYDVRSVYDGQKEKLKEEVDGFQADYLLNISPDDVHAYLLGKYRIEPLTLHPEQATSPGAEDVDIDVSHEPYENDSRSVASVLSQGYPSDRSNPVLCQNLIHWQRYKSASERRHFRDIAPGENYFRLLVTLPFNGRWVCPRR